MDSNEQSPSHLDEALALLHEALDGYVEVGDRDSAGQCAIAFLETIDQAGAPMTPARARLSEQVLLVLEWAHTGMRREELQMAPALLRAAETWLAAAYNSDGKEAEDAFERARLHAQALTTWPDSAEIRMIGYFMSGNALGAKLLTASTVERLEVAEAERARARLEAARESFGSARTIARDIGATMYGRICIQYAKTFTAQIGSCGDVGLIAETIAAWREAVRATKHDERTRSQLNLAGMLLQAVSYGEIDHLDELDKLLEEVAESDDVQGDQGLRAGLESLSTIREELGEALLERARSRVAELVDLTSNEADDAEEALRIAANVESRRRRLAEAVSNAPMHSLARDLILREPYNSILKDLERMQDEGVPEKDPALWQRALVLANENRALMEALIEQDHQKTSSAGGKALLAAYLQDGTPFVLLLRAFELEARNITAEAPAELFAVEGRAALPGEQVRISRGPGEGTIGRLGDLLSPRAPSLVIVNVANHFAPPENVAALFLRSREWHTVVFCLIAVAAAVVLVVPQEVESLSPGVSDEIHAIRELGAADKTVIVSEPKLAFPFNRPDGPSSAMSIGLRSWLEEQGFRHIFDADEAFGAADDIVRVVRSLLDSSKPEEDGAGRAI